MAYLLWCPLIWIESFFFVLKWEVFPGFLSSFGKLFGLLHFSDLVH